MKTNHERQRDKFEGSSGTWDSGKQLLTAVPQVGVGGCVWYVCVCVGGWV